MGIKQKDIKLLWGRSASRCAICKKRLSESTSNNANFLIGEQAHIVGEQENSARGKSNLTIDERNSYHNLILLCPNHHTEIDNNETDFTVEKLHIIKSNHELWVEEKVSLSKDSKDLAVDLVYSTIIDNTALLCQFDNWDNWISWISSTSLRLPADVAEELSSFINMIFKANFPNRYIELENALMTLSKVLNDLLTVYFLHARMKNDIWLADRFYRNDGRYNEYYKEDLAKYNQWERVVTDLSFDATRAANWVAEEVRKSINPLFYATEGKFSIIQGPDFELKYISYLPEYSEDEKRTLPNSYKNANIDKLK